MNVYGIIPARKNSRRISGKNIAPLRDKPLIQYTIEAAQQSKCLDRIIVSTDCAQTAQIAASMGVQIVMRPEELSRGDGTHAGMVTAHALQNIDRPDAVCWLQPSSPLRSPYAIVTAVGMMGLYDCDSVVSYVTDAPLEQLAQVDPNLKVSRFRLVGNESPVYRRSGDIYLTKTDVLLSCDLYGKDSRALIIPREQYCNINEPVDLKIAEALL